MTASPSGGNPPPRPAKPALLILASRSARRLSLLRDAGFDPLPMQPPFHDPPEPETHAHLTAAQWATDLAREKALSLFRDLQARHAELLRDNDAIILGADTIVVDARDHWLGQPQSRDAAQTMLRSLLNATHQVVTGVALLKVSASHTITDEQLFSDVASVTWGDVAESTLQNYLDSGDWRGKAGGYNLFELQDAHWPITHTGDPGTIVGLPMQALVPRLHALKVAHKLSTSVDNVTMNSDSRKPAP